MVHYIRLLRTPQVSQDAKKGLSISAVATVTTDLGDSFYGADVELIARLVDATRSGEVLLTQNFPWRDGFRAIKLNLQCNAKYVSRLIRLHVTTKDTSSTVAVQNIPEILDIWSESFSLKNSARTEALVERQMILPGKCLIRQWEETGDSIARHIWDASLGFLIFFRQIMPKTTSVELPILQQLLLEAPTSRLRVLEVGAGCGIVGIALAQLRKTEMVLTDLEDAQGILQSNVDIATPIAGSSIRRQILEWGPSIEALSEPRFDLVLVSDCIYNPDSSLLLVDSLLELCKHNPNLLILVGFKRRHDADDLFFTRMHETGFIVAEKCTVPLPHTMTDYDAGVPNVEMFVYRTHS